MTTTNIALKPPQVNCSVNEDVQQDSCIVKAGKSPVSFTFIPNAILDNIDLHEGSELKCLLTLLRSDGGLNTKELARLSGLSLRQVYRACDVLTEKKLITVESEKLSPNEIKEFICSGKQGQTASFGNLSCEWCGATTTTLHNHHFPTRKEHGGKETVAICPNCHCEYHAIEGTRTCKVVQGYEQYLEVSA